MNNALLSESTRIAAELLQHQQNANFAGHDPFDGLNSKFLQATPLYKLPLARLAWLQLFKLSPINLRPLFRVPKERNPKGIALFILGMLQDFERTNDARFLEQATSLGNWLLQNQCERSIWNHSCWGYHFDWQARAFYVPKGKPNIITTVYVAKALHALGIASNDTQFLDAAIDSARFIHRHLLSRDDEGEFFAYIPGETTFVHNASLWGAATCVSMGRLADDNGLVEIGVTVANRSAMAQQSNGAWPYGKRSHHKFVDGFHTGYNIEALHQIDSELDSALFKPVVEKGLAYYQQHFFLPDGTPKYYDSSTYPIDTHCAAQAILTLLKAGSDYTQVALAERVLDWTLRNMYLAEQRTFRYQRHRWYSNNISYVRWTQGWAYYALAFYNNRRGCQDT